MFRHLNSSLPHFYDPKNKLKISTMTFKSEYFNKFTPNRFRARIRLRLSEFLLSALFIDDVLLTALADADAEDDDTVIGVDNVCNADSLIE